MKIIFYCQYVFGMGHLFRSIELLRAFKEHEVTLVAGGRKVEVDVPDHINFIRLPALFMDEKFTKLISGEPDLSVEQIQSRRKDLLFSLLARKYLYVLFYACNFGVAARKPHFVHYFHI